ncbi:hypothetical protein THOD04_160021 [Vibrio owensii]|uniref:hypothetical protein n=1 Tax=Vibrio owensii TaxID=696485 RepID=UPI0028941900|nr:hypothetical protein THOD04_160021 [Vibrio owensii]
MPEDNYELFNEIAGKILTNLLVKIPMESSDSVGEVTGYRGCCKTIEDAPHEWKVFRKTVFWLRDEGFLRFGISDHSYGMQENYFRLPKATLTYKGLEALKSIPAPLDKDSTGSLADMLISGVKDGTKSKISEVTKQALSLLFTSMSGG